MNRYTKMLACALAFLAPLCAMEQEAQPADVAEQPILFDKDTMIVPLLNENEVSLFRETLEQEQTKRGRYRLLTAAVVIAGTSLLLYNWNKNRVSDETAQKKKYDDAQLLLEENRKKKADADEEDRKKREEELERIKKAGAAGVKAPESTKPASTATTTPDLNKTDSTPPATSSWPSWLSTPASWTWGHVKGVGSLGWSVGSYLSERYIKSMIVGVMGGYIFGVFPYPAIAARYVFQPWSMRWCMEERTEFYNATIQLKASTADMMVRAKKFNMLPSSTAKANVWYTSYQFVLETQKILGYMQFMIAGLQQTDKKLYDMGCSSIAIIRDCINKHASDMNAFLQLDAITVKEITAIARDSESCLYSVIGQLESFEGITDNAGHKEKSERDRFAYWKEQIKPGLLNKTPKVREDEALAQEMPGLKGFVDMALDVNNRL